MLEALPPVAEFDYSVLSDAAGGQTDQLSKLELSLALTAAGVALVATTIAMGMEESASGRQRRIAKEIADADKARRATEQARRAESARKEAAATVEWNRRRAAERAIARIKPSQCWSYKIFIGILTTLTI